MILDASVIAKWFLIEDSTDKALKIREEYIEGNRDIAIPDLLLYELANLLRYKDFKEEDVKKAVSSILNMDFFIATASHTLLERSIEISLECDITIYDATYVALSDSLGMDMITADVRLFEKTTSKYMTKLLKDL